MPTTCAAFAAGSRAKPPSRSCWTATTGSRRQGRRGPAGRRSRRSSARSRRSSPRSSATSARAARGRRSARPNASNLVLGITCHAVYHAGQVQLVKRLREAGAIATSMSGFSRTTAVAQCRYEDDHRQGRPRRESRPRSVSGRSSPPAPMIEVTLDDSAIRLERVAAGPPLVKVGRRLVRPPPHRPTRGPPSTSRRLVEEERNRSP